MKEQFTSPKMGTASAPAPAPAPTPAAEDDKTTSISPVVMDKTQGGMEVVNLPPAAQATSGNRATIDLEKTASLGILMTDADLSRVNLAAQLVSETIEVDTVYLVAVSPSSSDNDQACVLLAAHGMPIPAPRLDPVLHSRALARAGGLLYQNPEKSELEEDDPGLPICADVDGESYHAGLLVPVHLSPVSPSGSASFNSTSPPNSAKTAVDSVSELGLGLVLVALTTDPKRVLGIEDLRYLESFGNVIGPMVQKCLKASIEAARKEKEEAQARDAVQAKEDKKGRRKTALKGLGLSKKRSKGDLKTSTAHAHPNAHLQRSPATERGNPTDNFGSNFDGASLLNAPTPSVGPASPDSAPAPAPTGALPTRPSEPIRSKSFAAPKSWRKSKGPEQIAVAVPAA